jgi:hypothetical protein
MSLFWSLHHDSIAGTYALSEAQEAKQTARTARDKVADIEARSDKALLVCEALWTILRDKLGVTEEELVNRVNDIDFSDGKLDGKVRRPPLECPKGKRMVASRFMKCTYCGHAIQGTPFAR